MDEFLELLEDLDAKLDRYVKNPELLTDTSVIDLCHLEKSKTVLSDIICAVREDRLNREQPSLIISRMINEWYPEDVHEALRKVNHYYRTYYKSRE